MREVDLTKPLSDEDRAYLISRGKEQLVDRLDAQHGDEAAAERAAYLPGTATDENPRPMPPEPEDEDEDSDEDETDGEQLTLPEDNDPADNQPVDSLTGEEPDQPEDEQETPQDQSDDDYDEWSKAELVAELEKRNEDRDEDEELSISGNKTEMKARLRADDATDSDDE